MRSILIVPKRLELNNNLTFKRNLFNKIIVFILFNIQLKF